MTMKKTLISFFLILTCSLSAVSKDTETLNYVISYKWGIIHKEAGDATITLKPEGKGYEIKLTGKTKPWADRIYKMRDTLISRVGKENFLPEQYTRIAHEKGRYSLDNIYFDRSGAVTKGTGTKYREKNGDSSVKEISLEGKDPVYDILSSLYFIRNIDFTSLKPGETVKASVFSGDKSESLTVSCKGKERIKLKDKSEADGWHVTFKFTTGGGKKSSDDIDCWISEDSSRIPLLVVGSLPVGQVRCTYIP